MRRQADLLAEEVRHFRQVLHLIGQHRLQLHLRDDQLALRDMVKRRVQRHKAIAGLFAQAGHLLQALEAVQRTSVAEVSTTWGILRHSSFSSCSLTRMPAQ